MAASQIELAPGLAHLVGTHRVEQSVGSGIPEGFPADVLGSAMAWTGAQFDGRESQYVHMLSESDIKEAEDALEHFKTLGLDGQLVSRETFPLPTLGRKLDSIRRDLYQGKGFGLIRGLDPKKYSVEDLSLLYLGLQSHVADQQGRQDNKGNMLVHIVADNSTKMKAGHHRHSTSAITFHNEEAGDIVGWLTRSTAATGGKCIISSAYTVYNALAASRPDMIATLARSDWPFAMPQFHCRPILYFNEGRLVINFGRTPLIGNDIHPRPKSLPKVSARQMEALDAVEAIAKATQLEISTQAGDIHLINNLAVMHRREGFSNGVDQRRHLVRMRLRDSELGWAIPQDLKSEWAAAFDEDVDSSIGPQVWHIEPMPEAYFPLRKCPN